MGLEGLLVDRGGQQQSRGGPAPGLGMEHWKDEVAACCHAGESGQSSASGTNYPGGASQSVRVTFVGDISAQMHEAIA